MHRVIPKDDHVPVSIFVLLFAILVLSLLGTYLADSKRPVKTTVKHQTYIPGHVHAFYLEYVYYSHRDQNSVTPRHAPGVYSDRIRRGEQRPMNYGTV
ncbi:hypothetical protein FE257_010300 [Aspergillus nanangensis]|uniref:Uncharacterized protein n=1 Tax=Aspergillus nanangensis TaxID=2582783 RepID=A0AAD4GS81_ASPNN|nr:hypothetical protein FE257_010300 [Aspergillus nanangensis]